MDDLASITRRRFFSPIQWWKIAHNHPALYVGLLVAGWLFILTPAHAASESASEFHGRALILYDAPEAPWKKLGLINAVMLGNLLGHFSYRVDFVAIHEYQSGTIDSYDSAFYLGVFYNNPLPDTMLRDIMSGTKPFVWFRYNIWQLAWNPSYNFTNTSGIIFRGLRGLDHAPTLERPYPGFFNTTVYKDKTFEKFANFDPATLTLYADPDIGVTEIADPAKAQIIVTVTNPDTDEVAPYYVRSGRFWYVADVPFSYVGPRDRYLILCDLLHDILNIDHPESHPALVRIEDVNPVSIASTVATLTQYLDEERIPFSVSITPRYLDPLGVYNNGIPDDVPLIDSPAMISTLSRVQQHGGVLILHGYTHQYSNLPNPYSAASTDDYEYWDYLNNAPLPLDSIEWASERITTAMALLQKAGFQAVAWETPHYQASPNTYQAVGSSFRARYERSLYYTSNPPLLNLASTDPNRDFAAGQFFPYAIFSDFYGQQIIPENLGNYDLVEPTQSLQALLTNAEYAKVIRDGVASFFFHSYLLESNSPEPARAFSDFQQLIEGISSLGFSWTTPLQVFAHAD